MCRICDHINAKNNNSTGIHKMLSSFDYRGPSGQGIYKYRNVTLGHLGTEGRLYIKEGFMQLITRLRAG
jgi:asparagine synthetase B (glutamine-hydrolysing)